MVCKRKKGGNLLKCGSSTLRYISLSRVHVRWYIFSGTCSFARAESWLAVFGTKGFVVEDGVQKREAAKERERYLVLRAKFLWIPNAWH